MKVELDKEGYIIVIAETIIEAWALNATCDMTEPFCTKCENPQRLVKVDCSILLLDEHELKIKR